MSFSADIKRFAKKANKSADDIQRAVTIEWFSSTVLDTPSDTGRARGNWQTTTGKPATGSIDRTGSAGSIADIQSNMGDIGDITYMANNLPYIEELENGSSSQAPSGMVARNKARINRILTKAVRENKV